MDTASKPQYDKEQGLLQPLVFTGMTYTLQIALVSVFSARRSSSVIPPEIQSVLNALFKGYFGFPRGVFLDFTYIGAYFRNI